MDGLQGKRDMSPAPGATAEDSNTAGGLHSPDSPLPGSFAFHLPHTRLIPSTCFRFTHCTAFAQCILITGAFHKSCKGSTTKMQV